MFWCTYLFGFTVKTLNLRREKMVGKTFTLQFHGNFQKEKESRGKHFNMAK
jgi:hypothetical protein